MYTVTKIKLISKKKEHTKSFTEKKKKKSIKFSVKEKKHTNSNIKKKKKKQSAIKLERAESSVQISKVSIFHFQSVSQK